ncbi:hypothetical protein INR49_001998 [Caranx melampygus]|nr:hypothetical protein INR49_001998 [Caranx melampygus]
MGRLDTVGCDPLGGFNSGLLTEEEGDSAVAQQVPISETNKGSVPVTEDLLPECRLAEAQQQQCSGAGSCPWC